MLSSAEFHKDFLRLRIATHDIGVAGLKFTQKVSSEAICALLFEPHNENFSWKTSIPIDFNFDLERENDHSFKIDIRADFKLANICGRCLNPLEHGFNLDFSIRMVEREHLGINAENDSAWQFDSDEVVVSSDEDLSVGYFADKCIDLGIILRDQIFFQAPDYPHCENPDGSIGCVSKLEIARDNDQHRDSPFLKLFNKTKKLV